MPRKNTIDVLIATASDLHKLLDLVEVSSVELLGLYLDQIARHDKQSLKLNAIISTAIASRVIEEARALDNKRVEKGPRSKLHGIPISLKDLICTPTFGLETTTGSLALKGLNATEDASIATLL
ncbi:hypothetical protein N7488_008914 [Penicillium malachiteum]|nr:hypothetical protein N7488_008914 [Penicillium malachiteum]